MLLATSRVPHLQVARRAMTANTDLGQLQERCRSFRLPDDGEYFDLIMRVQEHLLQRTCLKSKKYDESGWLTSHQMSQALVDITSDALEVTYPLNTGHLKTGAAGRFSEAVVCLTKRLGTVSVQ